MSASLIFAAVLAAAPAPAAPATPAYAAPHRELVFLTPQDVAPAQLLADPPADQSAQARAERAELHAIGRAASRQRHQQAHWDYEHEDGTIFGTVLGPAYDLRALPATARLLDEVRNDEAIAASLAKGLFKRNRPWLVDPSLRTCARTEQPQSSYPSGHSTMAFAMAVVLAQAMPDRGPALLNRARDYAYSRLVCAMHYRSDTTAGETLGTAVAVMLLRDPKFRQDVEAAHAELAAAHLTQ
jgi:acid phosphatase (class A)